MSEDNQETGLEIAVIGMSGRFPGADDTEQYWRQLLGRHHSVTVFSDEELRKQGIPEERINHPDYVKAKPFLDHIYDFDASLFGYAPWEAENMDPQIRIFHECVYHALEHAGYHPDRYGGKIGMYAGASLDMEWMRTRISLHDSGSMDILESGVISYKDFLSQLISYKLNLTGPSYTLYTACSTSLAAIHLACQGLLLGDCNLAVAGGVTVEQPSKSGYLYREGRIESKEGVCRPFDSRADGTIFGDGAGAVVLKRLSDALEGGDYIYGVIKASACNNDGRRKVGFAAPSLEGQKEAILSVLELADIAPESIGYIETHGTGTHVGDPIEFEALKQIFGTEAGAKLPLGSVKGNIGHLHAAAGVASFIKAALALDREVIPPTAHFKEPNPLLKMEQSPFYVNADPVPWERGPRPRRAGISSFGVGGTNVHLVLEEAPLLPACEPAIGPAVLTFSAKSAASLERMLKEAAAHLKARPEINMADAAYTLQVGRGQFKYKAVCVADISEEAAWMLGGDVAGLYRSAEERLNRPVVFMFTGQGAQWPGMGAELYRKQAAFRTEIDMLCERLLPKLGVDLRDYMCLNEGEQADPSRPDAAELNQTWLAQPALFVLEYALARTWMDLGVQPTHMAGHSIGEYVAAALAGVFTLEDALDVVVARGRLMQSAPGGIMLAAAVQEAEACKYISEAVSLAAVNEPGMCVFSGDEAELLRLKEIWDVQGVFNKRLNTSHAFHSSRMEPVLEPFRQVLRGKKLNAPAIPFYSCLTGEPISCAAATDPEYWVSQLRGTVAFSAIIGDCLRDQDYVFLEVGPGSTLAHFVQSQARGTALVLPSLTAPNGNGHDEAVFLSTLSRLWLAGVPVRWPELYRGQRRRRIPLPLYPFDRQTYLPRTGAGTRMTQDAAEGPRSGGWLYLPAWKPQPLPDAGSAAHKERLCWLILPDGEGAAESCAERLKQRGDRIIKVLESGQFRRIGEDVYTLNPGHAEDYRQLAADLVKEGIVLDRVLHAWCLGEARTGEEGWTGEKEVPGEVGRPLAPELERGYLSLIRLAAALEKEVLAQDARLTVAAEGVFDLYGSGDCDPNRRALAAPVLTIPQEYPHVWCRLLDLRIKNKEHLTDRLLRELDSSAAERITVYRGASRLVQHFEPVTDTAAGAASDAAEQEMGCSTAEEEIFLVVSPADGGERIMQYLEAKGGGRVFRSEGCAPKEMAEAIRAAAGICGRIDGVFYVPDMSGHELRTLPDLAAPGHPPDVQARDFRTLNGLLQDSGAEIGFGWVETSLSSVTGGFGFAELAARAGGYDAAAEETAGGSIPWMSVSWDFIRSGSGGGPGISGDKVYELYDRLWPLRTAGPRIIVAAAPPGQRLPLAAAGKEREAGSAARSEEPGGYRERPGHLGTFAPPVSEAEKIVCEITEEQLGVRPIGLHDNFYDLGGHSLMLTRLLSRIKDVFRVEVPLKAIFDTPYVQGIIDCLTEQWGGRDTLEAIALSYREYQQLVFEEMK